MSERVTVSIVDGVADVRMNRPEKLNALDPAMFEGLTKMGLELASNQSVRACLPACWTTTNMALRSKP